MFVIAFLSFHIVGAQQTPPVAWEPLRFLVGQWIGEGTADTTQAGAGSCSFEPDLQTKVLVRRNHAEYPESQGHSPITHDDLMIMYPDPLLHQLCAF